MFWKQTLLNLPLFKFSFEGVEFVGGGGSSSPGLAGSTVFFDSNGNLTPDVGEPITFSDDQGRYSLHVPYVLFDKDQNGVIDHQDGRIVIIGGVDTQTGTAQIEPLVLTP
ncbi:hypothetical protein [Moorena producens]|uniref:hypothetical protein n=1 Tax=Moorena producens TaxID=1155739 RepID=UPI003C72E29E